MNQNQEKEERQRREEGRGRGGEWRGGRGSRGDREGVGEKEKGRINTMHSPLGCWMYSYVSLSIANSQSLVLYVCFLI